MAHFKKTSNEGELGCVRVRTEKESVNPNCKVYVSSVLKRSLELIVILNELSAFLVTATNPFEGCVVPIDFKDSMA